MEDRPESDPNGLTPQTPGAKLDSSKNRLGLVLGSFSVALIAVGEVGTYGARKYSDNGWLEVENAKERYKDALYRHLLAHESGELLDKETGLSHLAHLAWNSLAILHMDIVGDNAR